MRAFMRFVIVVAVMLPLLPRPALAAQAAGSTEAVVAPALRAEVLDRFRVLVIRDGIVLTPRRGDARSIEISGSGIAVDGATVTGGELREALGADADLVLQLSYVAPGALRQAFSPERPDAPAASPTAPPATPGAPPAVVPPLPAPAEPPEPPEPPREWRRKSGAKVHFLGDVRVDEDERVTEPVVAIGGNVDVRGQVDDDVVAVGGSVRLGPKALVRGSVTSVGGRIHQEQGAEIRGDVNEVAVGQSFRFGDGDWTPFWHRDMFSGWFRLLGTLLRISVLLLLALIVVIAASTPLERIARRAGDEPWVSGFVGLMAQVLFVPVLVLTVVVLAISIIGIPLLLLVPFALVALLFAVLMGFVGVARRVGQWAVGSHRSHLVATAVGVVLITAGTVLARLLWLIPGPIAPIAIVVAVLGLFVEYVAWTVGLGATLLTRFGTRGPGDRFAEAPVVPPPVPPPVPAEGVAGGDVI